MKKVVIVIGVILVGLSVLWFKAKSSRSDITEALENTQFGVNSPDSVEVIPGVYVSSVNATNDTLIIAGVLQNTSELADAEIRNSDFITVLVSNGVDTIEVYRDKAYNIVGISSLASLESKQIEVRAAINGMASVAAVYYLREDSIYQISATEGFHSISR